MTAQPLLPDFESSPKLVGIARIAAAGESLREGHKSVLHARDAIAAQSGGKPAQSSVYLGYQSLSRLRVRCKYCYARYTHEFMELRDGVEFERKIFVKQHAAALFRSELKRSSVERRLRLARRLIPISLRSGVLR